MKMKFESIPSPGIKTDVDTGPWGEVKNASFNGREIAENGEDLKLKGYEKTLSLLHPLSKEAAKNFNITIESRCFRLGGVALRLFNASQAEKISEFFTVRADDIRGMFSKNSERGFRLFFQDRHKQNTQRLQEYFVEDFATTFAEAYSDMMDDFPELRNVRLDINDGKGSKAFYGKDISGRILPTVELDRTTIYDAAMSIRLPEAEYHRQKDFYDEAGYVFDEVQGVAVHKRDANMINIINAVAKKLEIEPAKLAQNGKLLGVIMLAHEFGHHLDFRRNYFGVAMDKAGKERKFGQVLRTAFNMQVHDKRNDIGTMWYQMMHEERMKERKKTKMSNEGIMQQIRMDQEDYREQMHERIADTFAIDFVIKYAKKYGFNEITA